MDNVLLRTGTLVNQSGLMMCSRDTGNDISGPDWKTDEFRGIASRLDDQAFPGLFARHGWKSETLLFGLMSQHDTEKDLLAVMQHFIQRTKTLSEKERLYSPLTLINEHCGLNTLAEAHQFAWQPLQFLHAHAFPPWPEHIRENLDNSAWSFRFGGTELFVNIRCPGY